MNVSPVVIRNGKYGWPFQAQLPKNGAIVLSQCQPCYITKVSDERCTRAADKLGTSNLSIAAVFVGKTANKLRGVTHRRLFVAVQENTPLCHVSNGKRHSNEYKRPHCGCKWLRVLISMPPSGRLRPLTIQVIPTRASNRQLTQLTSP